MSRDVEQLCTFSVDDLCFGIDVMEVQEVISNQSMTRVPLASSAVSGLINLRGQIVTAIDLRHRMEITTEGPEQPMSVIVRIGDEAVSLLVDEIGEVIEVDVADRDRVPPTLRGAARQLVDATYQLPNLLLLRLNIEAAVALGVDASSSTSERNFS